MQRRHFIQTESLEDRLANEATKLRKEAKGTPNGKDRERLMRQAETGSLARSPTAKVRPPGGSGKNEPGCEPAHICRAWRPLSFWRWELTR
jgi:hypothetical protein